MSSNANLETYHRIPSVVCRNVSKTFYITPDGYERGLMRRSKRQTVRALQPTSFVAYQGESVGVIGTNGSGKSTLLSIIAGHETPTSGEVYVSSQPTLLGVSAALKPRMTGRTNITLGLLAMGLSPEAAAEVAPEVAEWSELGDALNRAMHTYSSGMKARLQFAITTAVKPDVLMIDEALNTGDSTFTIKAKERMEEFLEGASTLFVVSHAPGAIRDQTKWAIWIHQGETITEGESWYISTLYSRWTDAVNKRDRITAEKVIRRARYEYKPTQVVFKSEVARTPDSSPGLFT